MSLRLVLVSEIPSDIKKVLGRQIFIPKIKDNHFQEVNVFPTYNFLFTLLNIDFSNH